MKYIHYSLLFFVVFTCYAPNGLQFELHSLQRKLTTLKIKLLSASQHPRVGPVSTQRATISKALNTYSNAITQLEELTLPISPTIQQPSKQTKTKDINAMLASLLGGLEEAAQEQEQKRERPAFSAVTPETPIYGGLPLKQGAEEQSYLFGMEKQGVAKTIPAPPSAIPVPTAPPPHLTQTPSIAPLQKAAAPSIFGEAEKSKITKTRNVLEDSISLMDEEELNEFADLLEKERNLQEQKIKREKEAFERAKAAGRVEEAIDHFNAKQKAEEQENEVDDLLNLTDSWLQGFPGQQYVIEDYGQLAKQQAGNEALNRWNEEQKHRGK